MLLNLLYLLGVVCLMVLLVITNDGSPKKELKDWMDKDFNKDK